MSRALTLSPYELVLSKIEEGAIDPFDVDLDYLTYLFRETAEKLEASDYLREAGRFLEATAKLLKLQIEEIFPEPKLERRRITIKEVRDALADTENSYEPQYDLSWLWEHEVKAGRPSGAKDKKRRSNWRKVWESAEEALFHREKDYQTLAREVREKILKGEPVKTLREFIAYLHAYMEFEDVPELSELLPAIGTEVQPL